MDTIRPTFRPTRATRLLGLGAGVTLAVTGLVACGSAETADDAPADDLSAITVAASTPTTSTDASTGTDTGTGTGTATASPATVDDPLLRALLGSATARTVVDAEAELDVDDQSGDGRTVRIREVALSRGDGFVVVLDPRDRESPVLGTALVTRTSAPTSVRLDDPITGSGRYLAVLFADDGDGVFDPARDAVVLEARGPLGMMGDDDMRDDMREAMEGDRHGGRVDDDSDDADDDDSDDDSDDDADDDRGHHGMIVDEDFVYRVG